LNRNDRIRTCDNWFPKPGLYQTELHSVKLGTTQQRTFPLSLDVLHDSKNMSIIVFVGDRTTFFFRFKVRINLIFLR
jgi:hypothetical protein